MQGFSRSREANGCQTFNALETAIPWECRTDWDTHVAFLVLAYKVYAKVRPLQ